MEEKDEFMEKLQKINLGDGNLSLWNRVQETDPNYTKNANVKGNQITSIAPQYQILNATKQFGVYGICWGFKNIEIDYTLVNLTGLIYWSAIFFFPCGEMPATNSISVWRDAGRTKPDDQFAKKVETDSLTKCLSKLGFNADIFMGKFEDLRYLQEVNKKYKKREKMDKKMFDMYIEALKTNKSKLTIKDAKDSFEFNSDQIKELDSLIEKGIKE